MKKILRVLNVLVIAFAALVLFACKSKEETVKDKKNPFISNGSEEVASVVKDGKKLAVTNGEVYLTLKVSNGANEVVNLIDEFLMSDYLAKVTNEELKAAVDKEVFKDDMTDEEKEEAKKDYLEKVFVGLGINATDIYDQKILDSYKLSLAEKAYAKEKLEKEIKEHDEAYAKYEALSEEEKKNAEDPVTAPYFTEAKVKAKYDADHVSNYSVILVTFPTIRQASIALQAIGVKVEDGKWVNADGSSLSDDQILAKYIELYNYAYSYKGLDLNKDSEEFDYTATELNNINPTTFNRVSKKMVSFGEEGTWYIADPFETGSGSLFVFALKIDEEKVDAYDDLDDDAKKQARTDYYDALVEDVLTSQYIASTLGALRAEKNITIYDTVIEKDYSDVVLNYNVEFNKTTVEKDSVVASVDGKEVTCDELYERLLSKYGVPTVTDLLTDKYLLNSKYNTYYQDGTWVDSDKKADLEQLIEAEKTNFKNGTYSNYGYAPETSTWQTFMEASYSVNTEEDLLMRFLLDAVETNYTSKLNTVVDKDIELSEAEASALWTNIQASMQKKVDEYFSVKGIHLLVSSYKSTTDYISGATPLDPKEWTEEQNTKAVELIAEIVNYVKESTGTYKERLEKIVDAFKTCPNKVGDYTFGEQAVKTTLVSENGNATINVSLYKGYGLYVKFENLGTFTNGKMVEAFNDAVKAIYDAEVAAGRFGDKSVVVLNEEAIKTQYGYHLYINQNVDEPKYAERTENESYDEDSGEMKGNGTYTYRYLPTLEEIRTYTADNSSSSLSSYVKNAISYYYSGINSELTGSYFTLAKRVHELSGLQFTSSKLDASSFAKYVSYYENYVIENNLKLVTTDYLD